MRISDVPSHLRSWKPCQKIPPQSIWCFTVSVTIFEWFHTVLLAGVEVIQEHVVKKPILTLVISKLTDYYKVETSHWVPRLIRYRPTLYCRRRCICTLLYFAMVGFGVVFCWLDHDSCCWCPPGWAYVCLN